MQGPVAAIVHGLIPLNLPVQRATVSPKLLGYLPHPNLLAAQRRYRIPFLIT